MDLKIRGVITKICEMRTTAKGVALKQIFFKKGNGDYIYPTALGKKVDLLDNLKPGDEVELECEIKGSAERYNNVVILEIVKLK